MPSSDKYEEYVEMNMTAHPAWTEMRTTMFETQKKLLAELAKTDAAAAKQAAGSLAGIPGVGDSPWAVAVRRWRG